ncbi:MAG: hypothetical protein U0165_03600 [Polyangiaceae bacterium]
MTINIDNRALEGIRALVTTYGVDKSAKMLGIAREAMVRVLAGLPVRKGTVLVILDSLRAVNTPADPTATQGPTALSTKAESPADKASDSGS